MVSFNLFIKVIKIKKKERSEWTMKMFFVKIILRKKGNYERKMWSNNVKKNSNVFY